MNKPRALKPFPELDPLSPAERDQLWNDLHDGLPYDRAARLLGAEHFVVIKRHRLFTWWHRESLRRGLNNQLPHDDRLAEAAFLDLLNGRALPWSDIVHARVLRAAFRLTGAEDHTPFQLLAIQRIANNEFHQQIARERLELEKSRLSLRRRQVEHQIACTPAAEDEMKIAREELAFFQQKATSKTVEIPADTSTQPLAPDPVHHPAALPAAPSTSPSPEPSSCLSPIADCLSSTSHASHLPRPTPPSPLAGPSTSPSPEPPSCLSPIADCLSSTSNASHPPRPAPSSPPTDPIASIAKAIHLGRVSATPAPDHISRNLKLPLIHRVTCYTHARRLEADRGKNPDLVGRHAAQNFKSKLRWCPCGRDLPCPDHGQLGPVFFELSPDCCTYLEFLDALRLPCAPWGEIQQQLQKLAASHP